MTACAAKLCNTAICFSGEWPHLLAVDEDRPEQGFVLTQGHPKRASRAAQIDNGAPLRLAVAIGVLFPHVGDRDDVHSREDTPGNRARGGRGWVAAAVRGVCRRDAPQSRRLQAISLHHMEFAESRAAQAHCLVQHCVEHRRQIAGRGIDDLQHLGGRGLLLQSLTRLGNEPRVLHRNDSLRREILQIARSACRKTGATPWRYTVKTPAGPRPCAGRHDQTTAAANVHKPSRLHGARCDRHRHLHPAHVTPPCRRRPHHVWPVSGHRTERHATVRHSPPRHAPRQVEKPAVMVRDIARCAPRTSRVAFSSIASNTGAARRARH